MVVEYHRTVRYGTTALRDTTAVQSATATPEAQVATAEGGTDELTKVLNFIGIELESLERSGVKDSKPPSGTKPYHAQGSRSVPTGMVLQSTTESAIKCAFCSSVQHDTVDCQENLPVAEKMKRLAKEMRCFRCTRRGHRSRYCRAKVTCSSCGSRHVAVVCDPSRSQPGRASDAVAMTSVMAASNQIISNKDKRPHDTEVLLQTFRAWASSDTACTQLRGVVDGGSQKTFIREDIAQKLKLQVVGEAKLHIHTFANQATTTKVHLGRVVEVHLRSQYSPFDYVIRAVTIPFICQDLPEVPTTQQFVELLRREGHLIADDVLFPSVNCEAGIGLLVGSDELWRLLTGDVKRDKQDDRLVAIDTVFGWTFQGPSRLSSECTERSTTAVCVLRMGCTAEEQDVIKNFWELDSIGIRDEVMTNTEHDQLVLDEFKRNIKMLDGRYEVALPWKSLKGELGSNLEVAEKRLQGLVKRLAHSDAIQQYDEVIRNYLTNGHAEVVTTNCAKPGRIHYMPHRAVVRNESSTTKVRVVFDASSHAPGVPSLNDHLEKGPKLGADLIPVLLRFRLHNVAITADIQKAFLQIGIKEEDRDALRFLWFSQAPSQNNPHPDVQCWRMTRVPFGTTSSPFLLTATLQHHLRSVDEPDRDLVNKLIDAFYVDDLLLGVANDEEGKKIVQRAQDLLEKAGMKLSKWT
ncbi:uncharacterized protein LOC135373328 [Ornithodoros turicata]|uniref:uncharacterized protein LOC135373328 n=1 Tax=Ornithodoros turicata TaxID=34597 RepID=UPI0031388B0A